LAGTSWRAVDRGADPAESFSELEFGSKLAPSGMGQVRVAPGRIVLYQVLDGKLVMRYQYLSGKNRNFDFDLTGDKLTLTALSPDGKPLGTQHFEKR
jgi:hypothetical protein